MVDFLVGTLAFNDVPKYLIGINACKYESQDPNSNGVNSKQWDSKFVENSGLLGSFSMVPIMGKGWSYSLNEVNTCVAADIVAPGVLAVDLNILLTNARPQ